MATRARMLWIQELSKKVNFMTTVKPVLTATSEQRPLVKNGQGDPQDFYTDSNFDWKPSTQPPPMYNGHFLGVPRLAVVFRFNFTCIYQNDFLGFFWWLYKLETLAEHFLDTLQTRICKNLPLSYCKFGKFGKFLASMASIW